MRVSGAGTGSSPGPAALGTAREPALLWDICPCPGHRDPGIGHRRWNVEQRSLETCTRLLTGGMFAEPPKGPVVPGSSLGEWWV